MSEVALNNLWTYIQGLMLTPGERLWLGEKLKNSVKEMRASETARRDVTLPDSIRKMRGMGHFTPEEIASDERLAYILGR